MTDKPVVNADIPLDTALSLVGRLIAELFGTFMLVTGVIGAALFFAPQFGPLPVALAIGLTVIAAAYAVGHISGGHFNPAVTLGAAAAGRFAWKDVVPYIVAQLIGGALASTILLAIRSGIPETDKVNTFTAVSNGWGSLSGLHASFVAVAVTEIVLTALFLYVILGVTDRRAPSGFAPLAIGFTLILFHLIAIPISNASFNPARSLATAIYGGPDAIAQVWLFFVAPVVGALIAGFTYKPLFDRK
jgi:aquaporin Z